MTTEKYLNKENIIFFLNEFAISMKNRYGNISFDILIVGGSALALKNSYRNSTVDIDGCVKFDRDVKYSINEIARKFGIYPDWLNQDFMYSESYSRRIEQHAIYYTTLQNTVNIYVVDDLDQLCMKATAYRNKDIKDVKYLVSVLKLRGYTYEDFLRRFEFLYGDRVDMKYSARTDIRHLFKKK